jgi:hypothetical protein
LRRKRLDQRERLRGWCEGKRKGRSLNKEGFYGGGKKGKEIQRGKRRRG